MPSIDSKRILRRFQERKVLLLCSHTLLNTSNGVATDVNVGPCRSLSVLAGSLMPFALRCLHAQLPHHCGQTSTTSDRLYALLAHCRKQVCTGPFLSLYTDTNERVLVTSPSYLHSKIPPNDVLNLKLNLFHFLPCCS